MKIDLTLSTARDRYTRFLLHDGDALILHRNLIQLLFIKNQSQENKKISEKSTIQCPEPLAFFFDQEYCRYRAAFGGLSSSKSWAVD